MPPAPRPVHPRFYFVLSTAALVLLVTMTEQPVVAFGLLTLTAAAVLFSARQLARRRQAEQSLAESEQRLRQLLEDVPDATLVADDRGCLLDANHRAAELTGYSRDELLGLRVADLSPVDEPGHLPSANAGTGGQFTLLRKDGTRVTVEVAAGRIGGARAQLFLRKVVPPDDLDPRVREQLGELARAERKYREMFENATDGIFQTSPDGRYIDANPALARMYGYASPAELIKGVADIAGEVYVDPGRRAEFAKLVETEDRVVWFESQVRRKDGRVIWVSENARAVRDENGRLLYYEGFQRDVSDRKALEEQVQQAKKMDAVGRLAGGIAHDFNNILTVINGYTELFLTRLPAGDPGRAMLKEVREAGDRAAGLTGQLLAFSRKQVVQPRVLDLNVVVAEMERMLGRLIGEDVTLTTSLVPDLGRVRADPSQMEQVLMNLAVNARDAMPKGGRLTIETRNVELDRTYSLGHFEVRPGRYVLLAMSDTGVGMTEEVKRHVFEPFFTTKGQGKGTGLGLATVFGIVRQAGGTVGVYSEPGRGATFKVYLPVADGPGELAPAGPPPPPARGSETILLVEDEDGVRSLARTVLGEYGYAVLEAADGREAIGIADRHPGPIDLLVTDVVMPGLSGPEVAARVAARRPGVGVLYISGYTDDAVVRHGVLEAEVAFVQKPFRPDDLARRVRAVLDQKARPGGGRAAGHAPPGLTPDRAAHVLEAGIPAGSVTLVS
ncbi:MAG: domain S-box protein [Gemmataceae bacterium]|nr:domain S-box protein [Gemmataceae bacterium]